jgi:hypothetical protein
MATAGHLINGIGVSSQRRERIRHSHVLDVKGCLFECFAWTCTTALVKMGFGLFGVSSVENFLTP